jgi:hypothetical protein
VSEAVVMLHRGGVTWIFINMQAVLWFSGIGISHFAITSEKHNTL